MSIPLNAIDPEATSLRERRLYEHHLDLLAPVMDAIVTSTVPSIAASRTDKVYVTGGGYADNMRALDALMVFEGRIVGGEVSTNATHLWGMVVEYVTAVAEWINHPHPDLNPKPNPDPLTARSIALMTAGWLSDRYEQISRVHELDEYRDLLFTEIRHMQGRYGVHANPRRPRARCATCGALAVVVTWVDNPNGGPKPVKAGRCRSCGETYTETVQAVQQPHTAAHTVLSHECDLLNHTECTSMHCECPCGHPPKEEPEMTQTPDHMNGRSER
ncbi:hypothetical protein [Microbacterium sp. PM5]|uniref:hypothetical protein n=1 Tax=Microbacterium sp. PM5 TaxID=2014534 RepID=UPI000DD13196|nr:hypothetical protein [Microbacterium sp. PM5]AXA95437.1 hypothetical protein CEP17_02835 [Microbacterium sp. PM5]